MESPCRMVSCRLCLTLFSAFSIFYLSLSWQLIPALPVSLWRGQFRCQMRKKNNCFFFGHVIFQLNQLLDLAYYTAYEQLLLQNWKQHRNRHLGTRAGYAAAASRKDLWRAMPSVAAEFESQTLELPCKIC